MKKRVKIIHRLEKNRKKSNGDDGFFKIVTVKKERKLKKRKYTERSCKRKNGRIRIETGVK